MRRFSIRQSIRFCCAVAIFTFGRVTAHAQNAPSYWAGDVSQTPSAEENVNQPAATEAPPADPPRASATASRASSSSIEIPMQTRQVLSFYGGRSAQTSMNEVPHNAAYQSAPPIVPQQPRRAGKPFQNAANRPALSPYLNLFREERNTTGIPNYYAFVQPQLEQEAANQRQQLQSQRRDRQGAAAVGAAGVSTGVAQAGGDLPAHFMDTAQFYGGWRR